MHASFVMRSPCAILDQDGKIAHRGKIVGTGTIMRDDRIVFGWMIELDEGFYSEDKSCFVSVIFAEEENVTNKSS